MKIPRTSCLAGSAAALTVLTVATGIPPVAAEPLPYGPDTCVNGLVWRDARPGDTVCVTPQVRDATAQQNADPRANKVPGGGAYGPETCNPGFVWREAFDGDSICVTPQLRADTLAANAAAASNRAASAPPACPVNYGGFRDNPYDMFAEFNTCGNGVATSYPKCPGFDPPYPLCSVDHYNIGFGQRPGTAGSGGEVISGQVERDGDKPHYLFGTRPAPGPVVAFFRFQACESAGIGPSVCDSWSRPIDINLGNNELVAR